MGYMLSTEKAAPLRDRFMVCTAYQEIRDKMFDRSSQNPHGLSASPCSMPSGRSVQMSSG
jgi:hypothetical protein